MRWTLLLTFLAFSLAQEEEERLDFSSSTTNRVKANEEVVQGTISLNGTVTPETVSKFNWAAQNALVQACGHGSKVIANAILQLSWVTERGIDIKFFVLPRLGGGGDCARTLVEASAGGFRPPFPLSGPTRKPIFRNMMQNELDILGFGSMLTDMYLRLWRVTCQTEPVWRNVNSLTELNAATVCSTYASGWEVYFEPSITEPATATGISLGYSAGNSGSVVGQFEDKCLVANSPCFCSSMSSCGWRRREDGVTFHCKTLESGDTGQGVTCEFCAQQPGCPPSCSSASFPCQCAALGTCHWDLQTEQCLDGAGAGDNVPCSVCVLQDKCQALRPVAQDFRPKSIFPLTRTGPKSFIEVDFNMPLTLPGVAARGSGRFLCGTDGRTPATNSLQLLEYVVPGDAFYLQGQTLQVASGTVAVLEPTECTLVLSDGVVISQTDGLPSKPVEFGSYFFKLKDSVPPAVQMFYPANGIGLAPVDTQFMRLTFTERIRATANFSCTLTRIDVFNNPVAAPIQLGFDTVSERMLTVDIAGKLLPGRVYQVEISPESIIDYGSLPFAGLKGDDYRFKTSGEFESVKLVENGVAEGLPAAAIAGIAAGAAVLLLTSIFLCYKGYIAASEKHDDEVKAFDEEDGKKSNKDKKTNAPPIFQSDAIRDLQIDQLPETPDARKQGAVLFGFDDGDDGKLRETAMLEEGKSAPTNRRVSRASLRAEAFVDPHPTNQTNQHGHHHHHDHHGRRSSGNGDTNQTNEVGHHRHTNQRHGGTAGNEVGAKKHTNQRNPASNAQSHPSNRPRPEVRPPATSKKESPDKEPPKLKPGFFLRAWDSKSSG